MTLDEWKKSGSYYDYNGHPIFYHEAGRGEVILLIHGFPTSSWDWWKLWGKLTETYRVIALDMIGFGFSAKPTRYAYSISDQADLHESFLNANGIFHINVLAHDYGNTVAQELLVRSNERQSKTNIGLVITSLCFLNGGLFPETHRPLLIQRLLMSPIGSLIGQLFTRKKLAKNLSKVFGPNTQPSEKELDAFWQVITFNQGKKVTHLLIKYMAERKRHRSRWVGAMIETDTPLKLIDGVDDPISGRHLMNRYGEVIPKPDMVGLEGIGHFPLIEAPDLVLTHFLAFLKTDDNR